MVIFILKKIFTTGLDGGLLTGLLGVHPPFPDTCIEDGRLIAWVGANQEKQVRLLDAADAGVHQVVGSQVSAVGRGPDQHRPMTTSKPLPHVT